jgi:hypothetical protein
MSVRKAILVYSRRAEENRSAPARWTGTAFPGEQMPMQTNSPTLEQKKHPSNMSRRFVSLFVLAAIGFLVTLQLPAIASAQVSSTVWAHHSEEGLPHPNAPPPNPALGQIPVQPPAPAAAPTPASPAPAPQTASGPQDPSWPVNNKPSPATVVWDSHGLRIAANNSSLDQILHEVATETGGTVDGLSQDERIFGDYGPGPARDVLSQILDGSGYNMIMIGDLGQGAPRQILLSSRTPADPKSAAARGNSNQPAEAEEPPEPEPPPEPEQPQPQPQPQPVQNPFGGGMTPRSPQEIMQQMQQRQQQLQQQQQQQIQQQIQQQQQPQ